MSCAPECAQRLGAGASEHVDKDHVPCCARRWQPHLSQPGSQRIRLALLCQARHCVPSGSLVTHYTSLMTGKNLRKKAMHNAVSCACSLSCCLDSKNRAAPALSEKQAPLALRSCLQDHVPDKNFDLVSQLPASLHFGVYCRCAHMQMMLMYAAPAVQ